MSLYTFGTEAQAERGGEMSPTDKEEYQIQRPKESRYTTECIAIIQRHFE